MSCSNVVGSVTEIAHTDTLTLATTMGQSQLINLVAMRLDWRHTLHQLVTDSRTLSLCHGPDVDRCAAVAVTSIVVDNGNRSTTPSPRRVLSANDDSLSTELSVCV